ncbi:MAG: hypothetical protein ACLFQU_11665 [Candidatus Kapaibacterium sp.]
MDKKTAAAKEIMGQFTRITGLEGDPPSKRYLWTDAFALCNYLSLYQVSGGEIYKNLAHKLINHVHKTLGYHREDDPRQGPISGLSDDEFNEHPTAGGLRIGKGLPERQTNEPFDRMLEWERDGQYFHYLTKWMHALNSTAKEMNDDKYLKWARELAEKAHSAFTYRAGEGMAMYWKMSIDLSRPLVPSMGQHDPIDGLITYLEIAASMDKRAIDSSALSSEIKEMSTACEKSSWSTHDMLGMGGLLTDIYRLIMINNRNYDSLLRQLIDDAIYSFEIYRPEKQLSSPAGQRLAFRELGLSLGMNAIDKAADKGVDLVFRAGINKILENKLTAREIENFWLVDGNRNSPGWLQHKEINMAMLAASLLPEGFLIV